MANDSRKSSSTEKKREILIFLWRERERETRENHGVVCSVRGSSLAGEGVGEREDLFNRVSVTCIYLGVVGRSRVHTRPRRKHGVTTIIINPFSRLRGFPRDLPLLNRMALVAFEPKESRASRAREEEQRGDPSTEWKISRYREIVFLSREEEEETRWP